MALVPRPAPADDLVEGDYTYTIADGQATITGFNSFYSGALTITNRLGDCPVSAIGDWAFSFCNGLTSVAVPEGVTVIGIAFYGCSGLTEVAVPQSTTQIDLDAFYDCLSLAAINVEEGNAAFSSFDGVLCNQGKTVLVQCPAGKTGAVILPDSVTAIGARAFERCEGLTDVAFPEGLTSIGDRAFSNCSGLTDVRIPDGVTAIGGSAFDSCTGVTNMVIGASVGVLGPYAFCYCVSLASVTLPHSVTSVEEGAFSDCYALTSLIVPGSVSTVGDYAFAACSSLTRVFFEGDKPAVPEPDTDVFNATLATVYYLPNTAGWSTEFGGCPTLLWNPAAQRDARFGFSSGAFGFNIAGTTNIPFAVETCTDLSSRDWTVCTNALLDSVTGAFFFSDVTASGTPTRFYRMAWPR